MDIDIKSTDPVLLVQPDSRSEGKLIIHKKNLSELLAPVDDIPLSVISLAGPPSTGKSLLYGYMLRYLAAAELDEHDWMDYENSDKPLDELQWPQEGNAPTTPGIWGGPEPYILKIGEGSRRREIAVLLLYTQLSRKGNQWDSEDIDVCKLMGLSLAVSSLTIFNVYKHLDEQCLSAVGTYIKYAIQGQGLPKSLSPAKAKGKYSPATPLQNANFLIRDWNFPSDFPFGANGGRNFVKLEKLKEKPAHSRPSRESRLLINSLFENVSGCLLPFPGNGVISPEFQGSIKEMEQKFSKNLELFISHAVNIDQLTLKKDGRGQEVNGRKFLEMVEAFVKAINDGERGTADTGNILKRFRLKLKTTPGEQREYIKVGLQAYGDLWKKYEKMETFLDEKTMKDTHKKARTRGVEAFERAVCPGDDDDENGDASDMSDEEDGTTKVDENVKKILLDRMSKRFVEITEANDKRRRAFMEQCKLDSIKQYRETLEASYPEGKRVPTEKAFRRESKETKANVSAEYMERIGSNGDRDNMNEEQEAKMDDLMDKLEEEEMKYYGILFGDGDRDEADEEFGEFTKNENMGGRKDDKKENVEVKLGKSGSLRKNSSRYRSGSSFGDIDDDSSVEGSVKGKGKIKKIAEKFGEVGEGDDDEDISKFVPRKGRKILDEANATPRMATRSSTRNAQEEQKLRKDHEKVVGELQKTNFKRA